MRLLFLSDTHLGIDMPARPRVARPRRGEDFFRCFAAALAPALAGEVDAVLHGGDLLYRSRVPAWLAEAALAPLRRVAEAGVPVLLLPGNHERGRLPFPLLALHPRLHLLDRPRTVLLEKGGLRVAFSGFPHAHGVRSRFGALLAEARRGEPDADVRVLCLHQCVEGATCGPGDHTFTNGDDVIRRADLPRDFALALSGHVHRHQRLEGPPGPPVVYAGSTERTSFAEAGERKGVVHLRLGPGGLLGLDFRPLPARPMLLRPLSLAGLDAESARRRIASLAAGTPPGALVGLRLAGPLPEALLPILSAASLRALGGGRELRVSGPALRALRDGAGRRAPPGRSIRPPDDGQLFAASGAADRLGRPAAPKGT